MERKLYKKSELVQVEGIKKGRGRPKLTLVEVIKRDLSIKKITKNMTLNRT